MGKLEHSLSATLRTQGHRPALCIGGQEVTYRTLDEWSRRLAAEFRGRFVGVFAGSSLETYAGILAVTRSGRTYIPLNADFPDDRLLQILLARRPGTLIVDREHLDRASALLQQVQEPMRIVTLEPDLDKNATIKSGRHDFVFVDETSSAEPFDEEGEINDETPLYVLSTSGSTGTPKSIAIPRSNVADYVRSAQSLFEFRPEDRFSHFFKLSFDLSVHDIFVTWATGACLYVPKPRDLLDPVAFAKQNALTVWFSVPSLVSLAFMSRKLKAGVLPTVRHAIFCGEALSWENVGAFQTAAPEARITNLYGPTEATIAITHYSVDRENPPKEGKSASVPIGQPFPGQEALVVNADLNVLSAPGERGELLLGGSQLAPGYVNDPVQTEEAFLDREFPGFTAKRWYRTGDIVMNTADGMVFLGRSDTQIKFRGHRIELGEIEAVLQRLAKTPLAIVMAWPPFGPGPVDRLLAFLMPPHTPTREVHDMMRDQLPAHMVPARILTLDQPADTILNDNQKVDRSKIAKMYQDCLG